MRWNGELVKARSRERISVFLFLERLWMKSDVELAAFCWTGRCQTPSVSLCSLANVIFLHSLLYNVRYHQRTPRYFWWCWAQEEGPNLNVVAVNPTDSTFKQSLVFPQQTTSWTYRTLSNICTGFYVTFTILVSWSWFSRWYDAFNANLFDYMLTTKAGLDATFGFKFDFKRKQPKIVFVSNLSVN